MKIEFTKEWCLRMAELELKEGADFIIGTQVPPLASSVSDKSQIVQGPQASSEVPEANFVFGKFVQLMRRNKKISLEELAERTSLDVSELVEIEEDPRHVPEPRSVHHLANFFKLPTVKLMQISRLVSANDDRLVKEGIRFAARSEPTRELSREERAALEAFVAVLSKK